jgi:hypothetical protein
MDPIVIETPEALFQYSLSEDHNMENLTNIQLGEGFNLRFKICGAQWDGAIDYKIGKYITKIQQDILRLYSEATGDQVNLRGPKEILNSLRVTIKIEKGSSDFLVELVKAIGAGVSKMEDWQYFTVFCTIILGYFSMCYFRDKSETKTKLKEIEERGVRDKSNHDLINKALDLVDKHSTAPKFIVAQMQQNDKIEFPIPNISLSGREAKDFIAELSPTIPEMTTKTIWVDDVFYVSMQDYVKGTVRVRVEGAQQMISSLSMMTSDSKQQFQGLLGRASVVDEIPEIKLRLALHIDDDNSILDSFILEVNPQPKDKVLSFAETFPELILKPKALPTPTESQTKYLEE